MLLYFCEGYVIIFELIMEIIVMSFPEILVERTKVFPDFCLKEQKPLEILNNIVKIRFAILEVISNALTITNQRFDIPCPPGLALEGTFTENFFSITARLFKEKSDHSQINLTVKVELLRPLEKPTESTITCKNTLFLEHPDVPNLDDLKEQCVDVCEQDSIRSSIVYIHDGSDILA